MSINIEVRQKQLQHLEQLIGESRLKLKSILNFLEWTEDKVKEGEDVTTCAFNCNHRVPASKSEEHHKVCELKTLNYNVNETFLSEPLNDPKASVYINNEEKRKILSEALRTKANFKKGWNGADSDPKTSDRLTSTFSPDERLALYKYSIGKTTGPRPPPDFNVIDPKPTDRELTYEELLEQERNAKRRRIKYKAVHTSRKNHTEVLRDVITNQMELYEEWISETSGGVKSEPKSDLEVSDSESKRAEIEEVRDDGKRNRSRNRSKYRQRSSSPNPQKYYKRSIEHEDHRRYKLDGNRARRRK